MKRASYRIAWKRAGQLTAWVIILLALLDWTGVFHVNRLWQFVQQIELPREQRGDENTNESKPEMRPKPVPEVPSGWIYRETRRPSFTLFVPNGWTTTKTELGIKLISGKNAYASVQVFGWIAPAESILMQLQDDFERQLEGFRQIESGRVPFGGHKGVYAIYSGVSNAGVEMTIRIVLMTYDRHTYALVTRERADANEKAKRDLKRIEASFSVEPP